MNWDDARVFLAVARTGQILAASKRLGVNHATLSRRVSALEKALATRLLIRRTNGCELTAEGEAFFHAAERMETEMLAVQSAVGRIDAAISGTVRIGAPDGFGVSFLAPRLGALTAQYPDLKIQLVPVPRSFSLSRREADIAITLERPTEGRLVSAKLTDYSLGLYVSKSYVASRQAPHSIEDIKNHRRIGYVEDLIYTASLNYTDEIMRNWDASFEVSSAIGQTEAVRSGAGVGILHNYIARNDADLIRILPEAIIKRAYWTTWHESARELLRVKTVIDWLQDQVRINRSIFI